MSMLLFATYLRAASSAPHAGIEDVTEGISNQVPGQHEECDRRTREDDDEPVIRQHRDPIAGEGNDLAPVGISELHTDAQETQCRKRQHIGTDVHRRDHHRGENRVGEDVAEHDAPVSRAGHLGGEYKFTPAHREDIAAQKLRVSRPSENRQRNHGRPCEG